MWWLSGAGWELLAADSMRSPGGCCHVDLQPQRQHRLKEHEQNMLYAMMRAQRVLRMLEDFQIMCRRDRGLYPCTDLCPMAHLNLNSQLIIPELPSLSCLHSLRNFRNVHFSSVAAAHPLFH